MFFQKVKQNIFTQNNQKFNIMGQPNLPVNIINHSRLGPITLKQQTINKKKLLLISIQKLIQNKQTYENWKQTINQIQTIQIQESILFPKKHQFQKLGLCGMSGILHIQYDAYMYDLLTQINNRKLQAKHFLQVQIWYLIFSITYLASSFQKKNKKIGDIHPNNILINQQGHIKIISKYSFPEQLDNLQFKIQNTSSKSYLAPQEIKNNFQEGKLENMLDVCRAQIFCIGLTILSVCTLSNLQDLYLINSYGKLDISIDKINTNIKSVGQHYSSFLQAVLQGMLQVDPYSRKKGSQIYESLIPYKKQILLLEPFLPDCSVKTRSSIKRYDSHDKYNSLIQESKRVKQFYKKYR